MAHATYEAAGGYNGKDCLHVKTDLPSCTMKDWVGDAYSFAASSAFVPVEADQPYFLGVWVKGAVNFWLHVWTYETEDGATFVHSTTASDGSDRFSVPNDNEWHLCASPQLVFPERSNYAKVVLEIVSNLPETPFLEARFSDIRFLPVVESPIPRSVTVLQAINDRLLTPKAKMRTAKNASELVIRATRGECRAASFAVEGPEAGILENLLPVANNLVSEAGDVIPAAALELHHVALWYTGHPAITLKQPGYRALNPELLLKNPSLVKPNEEDRGNYLLLDFPERPRYAYVSAALDETYAIPGKENYRLPIEQFPIRDSKQLSPIRLAMGERWQFWITLRVPDDALPGTYYAQIDLRNDNIVCAKLPIRVEVLPFELSPLENFVSSIYYKGQLGPNGSIGAGNYSDSKNAEQFLAEMRDLKAHGVDNPPIFMWWRGEDLAYLDECLTLRELAGMSNRVLFLWGSNTGASEREEDLAQLRTSVEKALSIAKAHGCEELYFYGIDEARPDVLAKEQATWKVVHDAGAKVYVAVLDLADALDTSLDLAVVAGEHYTPEQIFKAKSLGIKLLSYGNPQGGCITPETYRRNYGLLLWQRGFDGAMTHAYQCGYGFIWNDFDGLYRDENMTYPTADGVIDTIQWEGYREGLNDLRYLTTLQDAIRKAPAGNVVATKAAAFLADLRAEDLVELDLDDVRSQIIDWLLQLN